MAGNDAGAGGPRGRVGQISHSVVLGTFNVGDQQGEGIVPDLSRVRLSGSLIAIFSWGQDPLVLTCFIVRSVFVWCIVF